MKKPLSFAIQLKRERDRLGLSQEDVAFKIGCSEKTVARWEAGVSFPRAHYRQKLSELFAKSVEEFGLALGATDDIAITPIPQTVNLQPSSLDSSQTDRIVDNSFANVLNSQIAMYQGIQSLPPPTHPTTIQQREQAVRTVYTKLIQPDVTAIVLTGIGGVGKSTLAALVYRYVQEHYQTGAEIFTSEPLWLTINERVTMVDVMGTLFDALGKLLPNLGELAPASQAMALFHVLHTEEHTRLIVLDQFENVLDWQTGYALIERPGIGEWLDAINSQPCKCKILLTSRIWPQGTREYPPTYMQEYSVGGLDVAEGSELLRKQGVEIKQASNAQLRRAVTRCAGHALALTLLASLLRQNRSLNLSLLFKNPLYSRMWHGDIARKLLDYIYLKQLNELQRQLLLAFAIYREAVPLDAALALINPRGEEERQIPLSFQALLKHRLIQTSGKGLYHLHAIVTDYVREQYTGSGEESNKQIILDLHARAAQYYLQQVSLYCPPLEQRKYVRDVLPLIEAAWHMCFAEQWQEACHLIYQEELYQMLRKWGENTILLELYQLLLPSERWMPEPVLEAEIYDHLGRVYAVVGKKGLALEKYEHALRVYDSIEVCRDKGRTLNHLGLLYESLGQDGMAKEFHERALVIAREVEDCKGEADSLAGLGWIYHRLGQQEEALHCCQQALKIHHEIGNLRGEGDTLNALGLIYHRQGKLEQALQYYTQSLSIRQNIGNRGNEAKTLNHLGLIFTALGLPEDAQECYRKSLIIRKEVGDIRGEGIVLYNLSKLYFKRQDYAASFACVLLARKIFKNVQSEEYQSTQGWIETLRKTVGQDTFVSLRKMVEQKEVEIVEKALKHIR